ncbi:MAG: hypothetical protein M9948_04295 [Lentimicrobium sp.]|nr:hypothetical protein [Lentimicrobium sp.]
MKTFYRIFGGKNRKRALMLFALISTLQVAAQPEAWLTLAGNASICPGNNTSIQVNFNLGTPPFIIVYSIDGTTLVTIKDIYVNPYVITTSTPGTYALEHVYDFDGTPGTTTGSPVNITGLPLPSDAGSITGSSSVCQGSNGYSYSVPQINNATSYVWSLPAGATIASGSNTNNITVNFSSSAVSGDIIVYGQNTCGDGNSSQISVTANPMPAAAGLISGTNNVCQSTNSVSYSISPIANATGYVWTVPAGASIATGANSNSITVNFSSSAVSGDISVYGTNGCGNGSPSVLPVIVSSLPATASAISGPASACQGQTGVVFTVNPIANATDYIWTMPVGASITAGANTRSITVDFSSSATSGDFYVRGSNSCGTGSWSPNHFVNVDNLPSNAGTISGKSSVCQGENGVTYSVPAINNATGYEWQLPTGASISNGFNTNQITVNYSATASSGNILVRGTNSCGSGQWSAPFAVSMNNLPIAASSISGPASVCQNQTNLVFTVAPVAYATSYEWVLPAGFTVNGASNSTSINLTSTSTASAGNLRVRGVNSCGNGAFSPDFSISVENGPTAFAGASGTVCPGSNFQITGATATNASSISWGSNGDGVFNNPSALNPIYTPGPSDISSGSVVLTLTANGNGSCSPASSSTTLTISAQPSVNAGSDGSICYLTGSYLLNGTASNYSSTQWQVLDGTGSFGNTANLSTTYLPTAADAAQGYVTIQLTAYAIAPCTVAATDVMKLTIVSAATANAGIDATSCGTNSYNLNGSTTNSTSVLWSGNGTGSFVNANSPSAIYIPSPADVANGSVTLTLTAFSNAPCAGSVSDNMLLTLVALPTVDAGPDAASCASAGYTLSGSQVTGSGNLLWTSSGNGTFSNPASLHPVYFPDAADILNGSVTLTLTVYGSGSCSSASVNDFMTLFINPTPTANAGAPASVCEGSAYTISDATATNYTTVTWTTSGTGTFTGNGTLNPTYTPSLTDAIAGSVNLTLTVNPMAPCATSVTSVKAISITRSPLANAGANGSTCGTNPYTIAGASAANYSSLHWSTSGTGSFANPSALNATYIPSNADITSGTVTLTLNLIGNSPCSITESDDMVLTINDTPTAEAGIDGATCETSSYTVSTATATNYSSITWTSSGTGTLTNAGALNPTYTPSHADALNGIVTLTMSVDGIAPCTTSAVDIMQIVVTPAPIVNAGANFSVCGGASFTIPIASAQFYSSLLWTSSGTGSLVNATNLDPTYTPSAADISNGSVIFTLTANGNSPCIDPVSDAVLVTINQIPSVNAGNDITICEGPHNITGATASNYSTLTWSSNGDGTFINGNSLNAIFTPGPGDLINGMVTLTLTANALPPCTDVVTDNVIYTIRPEPQAYAGPNSTVCEGSNFDLINATAANFTSVTWSTSGSGNFSNMNTVNPVYTPSLADIANGAVILTLTANNAPCQPETSSMTLTIRQNPIANAGSDASICENASYTINNASAQNGSSVLWSSSGSGTLQNPTTLTPTYIPSAADVMMGVVQLTMVVQATAPCLATSSDVMEITITHMPTAYAGSDDIVCASQTHTISGSNASNYSSLAWSTSGDGTILAGNTLYPTYMPGTVDASLGFAILTLTAYSNNPCTTNATDQMLLTIVEEPVVNAGADIQICVGSNVPLTSATAQSVSSVYWTTSGSGSFSDPTLVNPVYTPSAQDISNGNIILTITGQGISPCNSTSIDIMTLQISQPPVVDAGSDGDICETDQYYISDASATNYSAITWTTMGDGSFSNHNSINPTYTPGPADIAAGSVLLYLNATSLLPCSGSVSDAMLLTIHPMPQISAGPDAATCEGNTYLLSGATALDYSSLQWTSDGSGWFSNGSALNPIYTPSPADIIMGQVTLTLNAVGLLPCTGQVSDMMVLTITPQPTANAGNDETICQGSFTITTASASDYNTLQWVSSGSSGTLLNANTITPTYNPSAADIAAGSVVLTLTATANTPCAVNAVDQMIITIRPFTTVDAGSNETICQGSVFTPNSATASNYNTISWSTSGSGSFINANTLTPTYTPSPADIALGWVTLTLNATSIAPCTQNVSDNMILTITRKAVVDAGPNSTICETSSYTTAGASATNSTSLQWTSNGTGTFTNPNLLVTVYNPSAADIANGTVILTLTAGSQAPCNTPVSDNLLLRIQKAPVTNAGPDAAICENDIYVVTNATAANYLSLLWTSSGNGTFVDATTLHPTYTPGSADIASGTVTLTLTAQANAPCSGSSSDSFILTINQIAQVDAGADASACEGTGLMILDASATGYNALNWTTSGTGTFNNGNSISPTYFPSVEDVNNGMVILTLTASSNTPCTAVVTDQKLVNVTPLPTVDAGPDVISCGTTAFSITGASASDYTSLLWSTSGSGIFSNASLLNPSYTPSAADLLSGSVTLTLTANSAAPCVSNPSDFFILNLQPQATADAGADATICEGSAFTVFDATATNYISVNWMTDGTGVLSNANTLSPTYVPSAADALAGTVTMRLTSNGYSPCGNVTDIKILTISKLPVANAGADATICYGSNYQLINATAQNYTTLLWSTNGSGSFSNPTVLTPVYTPSAADLLNGQVILTLTANAIAPCNGSVNDFMILQFNEGPVANAGTDASICIGSVFTVTTASASDYLSLNWTTSGTGTFTFGNTLTPTYTPSAADLLTGFVTLTLHAYGNPPCAENTNDMILTFTEPVSADAGADMTVCEGTLVVVADASAQHYSSINWTSSGTGTLSNATSLMPTYLPSAADVIAGSVNLTLTATGSAPCNGQAVSMKVVNITPTPTVSAGSDASLCKGNTFTVSGATASGTSSVFWTTSGSGSFSGNGTLSPTYTPSPSDFISGSVTLTITGNAVLPCSASASDAMILTLIPSATVNAGTDASICETDSYTVNNASAGYYSSLV